MQGNYEEFISLTLRTRNLGDHQECSQEIGNTNGSRYALLDKKEQSELSDWW